MHGSHVRAVIYAMRMGTPTSSSFLDKSEIRCLDSLYLDCYSHVASLKRAHAVAGKWLVAPRFPSALSESIAAQLVPRLFGNNSRPARGPGLQDLMVLPSKTSLAVKGTGPSRWISLTGTDLEAEGLIWIDYSRRLTLGAATIDVWCFWGKVGTRAESGKATLRQLQSRYDGRAKYHRFSIKQLTRESEEK